MRDIRGDLQDRASLLEEQINSAQTQFEKLFEQLKREHDNRLEDLKAELEAVNTLMELEHRRLGSVAAGPKGPQPHQQAQAQPHVQTQSHAQAHPQAQAHAQQQPPHRESRREPQPQQPLADFLIRKLGEIGAMSREDLRHLSIQEGYFADGDNADRGVHVTLVNIVKAGLVRQLPNGNFAPATVLDTIRLRRAI